MARATASNRFKIRDNPFSINIGGTTNGGLTVANSASLNPTAAVSIETWFYLESLNSVTSVLFDNSTSGTTNSYYLDVLTIGGYGLVRFLATIGGTPRSVFATLRVIPKTKYFITATYTGSAMTVFVNGASIGSTTGLSGAMGTNSGTLYIGRQYAGSATQAVIGYMYRPRVYNVGTTLTQHQNRYLYDITGPTLAAGLVLDLAMTEGAGSSIADVSGQGNTATIVSPATWSGVVPFKNRKQINGNLVKNGDFESAPPFTAATTSSGVWVDGTSGGSTTNYLHNWGINSITGSGAARFDSGNAYAGSNAFKVSTTATGSKIFVKSLLTTTLANLQTYGIQVKPSTSYTCSFWMKTTLNSGSALTGALVQMLEYGPGGSLLATNTSTTITTTTSYTQYSFTFTTNTATEYVIPLLGIVGDDGSATLIMDAWFDEVTLKSNAVYTPASPAVAATGTITVTDYQYLAGKDATATFTVTDYTLMAGGNFDIFGFVTITEGIDFNAVSSNEVTASDIVMAINVAVGFTAAAAVGAVVTLTVPGSVTGLDVVWSGTGVSPTTAPATGGFSVTALTVGSLTTPFGTDPGYINIGTNNNECATNIAAAISGGGATGIAVGNVVTVTASTPGAAGNALALVQAALGGSGTPSNGLTLSGATLSGGADATSGSSGTGRVPAAGRNPI